MSSYPRSASEHVSGIRAPEGQINPFVLPSETNIRFALQVVAAIALALNLGVILGDRLGVIALSDIAAFISDAGTVPVGGTPQEYTEQAFVQK